MIYIREMAKVIITALIVKTKTDEITKINPAIIINFIYYRHSVLNVCLSLIQPSALHSVFFYASLRKLNLSVLPH